jgi:SsrA-binding protein
MSNVLINNKKARFEYELIEKFTAGIILTGSEIKSIRNGQASIKEAYCFIENEEMWIRNMHISPYEQASSNNHDPLRLRKLLLNGIELKKIIKKLKNVGITIVPLKVFINNKGWAKMEISLARGKKQFDKREDIKKKDSDRQWARDKKGTL